MRKHNLFVLFIAIVVATLFLGVYAATGEGKGEFARTTIDIGIVVSNVEKAAKFYKDALGFTEVPGFDVSKEMGRDSGLTDSKAFHVRVFVLGDEPTATKIKLMQFADAPGKKIDNQFIHSSLGFRYLTISVSDTNAVVERAKKAGVVPSKEPYQLGGNNYLTLLKDPDGNIIELVGPKKN
jgi:catechol 2,3-dioxygenase-like lactoylglutathione lyase family enzyme